MERWQHPLVKPELSFAPLQLLFRFCLGADLMMVDEDNDMLDKSTNVTSGIHVHGVRIAVNMVGVTV